MANISNILQFPHEILEKIWSHVDRKSLICFACCSRQCYNLLVHIIFEVICIRWDKIHEARNLLSDKQLQFTKSISFEGDWCKSNSEFEELMLPHFSFLINCCNKMRLRDFYIMEGYQILQDKDLVTVFQQFVYLRNVVLCNVNITNVTFHYLQQLQSLEKLALRCCYVSEVFLHDLRSLNDLSIVECCLVSEKSIDYITKIHGLKRLILSNSYKADGDREVFIQDEPASFPVLNIKELISLEYLDISYTPITNEEELVSIINALKSLKEFYFSHHALTYSINEICDLPQLTSLTLFQCNISDEQVQPFIKLKNLRYLDICLNFITDNGLAFISQMVSLKDLDVSDNQMITDKGILHLCSLNLEFLDISNCSITDNGLLYISRMVSIESLHISENNVITDAGIKHLMTLLKLIYINIRFCYKLTGSTLVYLSTLPLLRRLSVKGTSITDENGLMKILKKQWEYHDDCD